MLIVNDDTPTSLLTAIKVGDSISNGLGTFGEVAEVNFEDHQEIWQFTFTLVGGGFIVAKKQRSSC